MTAHAAQKLDLRLSDGPVGEPSPPAPQRLGQDDPNICDNLTFEQSDSLVLKTSDDPSQISAETIAAVRKHQQTDLAKLRDAFRSVIDGDVDAEKKPAVTCSELNQLASAVARIHTDERELYGITPPEPQEDNTTDEDLSKLTNQQLLELCFKEGIAPSNQHDSAATKTPDVRTGPA